MKILFDMLTISFTQKSGIYIYSKRILESWYHSGIKDVKVLVAKHSSKEIEKLVPTFEIIEVDVPVREGYMIKGLITSFRRLKAVRDSKCDVVFYPMPEPIFFIKPCIPQVMVMHDTNFSVSKWYYRKLAMPWQFFRATKIISISNFTRQTALKKYFFLRRKKITTIHNGIDYTNKSFRSLVTHPYILNVNTLYKYKNVDTLVKAFALLKNKDYDLVIVGADIGNRWEEIHKLACDKNVGDRVFHMQNLSDEDLLAMYQNAKLFVSPSTMEGFGQTPIEAGIYKCPVVCSTMTALPESTLGLVNYYEPVYSEHELAKVMEKVLRSSEIELEVEAISNEFKKAYDVKSQSMKVYDTIQNYLK